MENMDRDRFFHPHKVVIKYWRFGLLPDSTPLFPLPLTRLSFLLFKTNKKKQTEVALDGYQRFEKVFPLFPRSLSWNLPSLLPTKTFFYGLRQNWAYEAPNEFTFLYVMLTATKEKSTKLWKENDWLYTFIFTISRLTICKNRMRKSHVQGGSWKKSQYGLKPYNSIFDVDNQQLIMLSHIFLL